MTEGPFNEAVIVDMIRSGLAEDGHICPMGGAEWVRLAAHPPFAEAMEARRVQRSTPPPPAIAVEITPAPVPSPVPPMAMTPMGPPVQMDAWRGPPPSYASSYAPASQSPQPGGPHLVPSVAPASYFIPQSAPSKRGGGSKVALVLGLLGAVVVVVGGGGAFALYMYFRAPPPLAQYYPESTQIYVEAPNVKRALLGLAKVDVLEPGKSDDTQASLARAFDLSPADAARVALGVGAVAFGGRDLEHRERASLAVMIAWSDAKAAETLLASPRFTAEGSVGKGGKRYGIKRREVAAEAKAALPMTERALSQLAIDTTDKNDQLLWFPAKKLLVLANSVGASEVLERIEGGRDKSLASSPAYASQKTRFGGDADLVGFMDSSVVRGAEGAKSVEKYFHDTGLITLAASIDKPGVRIRVSGQLSVPADRLAAAEGWLLGAPALSLPNKLPKETFAYAAFSTRMKKGKAARDELYANLAQEPSTAGLQKSVEEAERALGVDVVTVFDAIGDEGVIALAAKSGAKLELSRGAMPSWEDVAVIYAQKIGDVAAAKRLTATLKSKLAGTPFKVQSSGSGDDMVVEAEGSRASPSPLPRAELRYVGDSMVVVVGSRELADNAFATLGGKSVATLAKDHAHVAVTEPLHAKHALVWIDLGRVTEAALVSQVGALPAAGAPLDFDFKPLRLNGEKRVGGAVSLELGIKDQKLAYTVDSINLPVAGALLVALAPARDAARTRARADALQNEPRAVDGRGRGPRRSGGASAGSK